VRLRASSSGVVREVRVTAKVQERFAAAAAEERGRRDDALARSGADVIELSTDGDWLAAIVQHTQRKRVQAVRGVDLTIDSGRMVAIAGPSGRAFARGLVAVDADVARGVMGRRTGDLPAGVNHEVVHRDDLVVLPS